WVQFINLGVGSRFECIRSRLSFRARRMTSIAVFVSGRETASGILSAPLCHLSHHRYNATMKVPLSWLRDYVDWNLPVAAVCERLTLAGLEVAGVQVLGLPPPEGLHLKAEEVGPVWDKDRVVIGEILDVQRHPDADRLTLPIVAYGEGRTKTL